MRHQQDPAEKRPRQVAVIAVRRNGVPELCLIRRKDSDKWGIPKGFIDPGDSPEEAALTGGA
jgi:ADP-ribose pyrophosphatase YjhB (NUDIX family)